MKSKDAGSIPATSTVIMPLTCNDAVQRSRIPLPPPPLRGNGLSVSLGHRGGGSHSPWAVLWSVPEINTMLTASTSCQQFAER